MKVLKTVYRGFGQSFIYATAGQTVTLIADHGNVLIVQDIHDKKFPVMKVDVSDDLDAQLITTELHQIETVLIKKKVKAFITQSSNQLFS